MHRRGNVNIKVYYQQIVIVIVFATSTIFQGRPGGRIKLARGPHAAPGPHVGQPWTNQIKELVSKLLVSKCYKLVHDELPKLLSNL